MKVLCVRIAATGAVINLDAAYCVRLQLSGLVYPGTPDTFAKSVLLLSEMYVP